MMENANFQNILRRRKAISNQQCRGVIIAICVLLGTAADHSAYHSLFNRPQFAPISANSGKYPYILIFVKVRA